LVIGKESRTVKKTDTIKAYIIRGYGAAVDVRVAFFLKVNAEKPGTQQRHSSAKAETILGLRIKPTALPILCGRTATPGLECVGERGLIGIA
jgi:hypothetical protein